MAEPGLYSRRAFLARVGILGAILGGGGLLAVPVWARQHENGPTPLGGALLQELVAALRPVLDGLALDAMNGLAAFALPGNDHYSAAQGTPEGGPGAIAARGGEFMIQALDNFVPFPDQLATPLAAAFSTALSGLQLPLPNPLGVLPVDLVNNVDSALAFLLQNHETIPLPVAVALLLNLLATEIDPLTLDPPQTRGPFARLSYANKAKVFALIEGSDANLVAALDTHLPQPLHSSLSGLFQFLGGSLLEFAAFGSLNEFGAYDPTTRQLTSRPVGWQLSGYSPNGPEDGWDEFKGYYQGRRHVADV